MSAAVEELVRRVDELESRAALRDLVTDYCRGFDTHDWDTFIGIWHEDAIWEIGPPFGAFQGHEGIREAVFDVLYPAWRETHHLASNLKIEFDGPDRARGVCDVDCMGAAADDIVQMISATYTDDFERRDGVWKIAKRHVVIHYFNPVPGAEMSAPEG
ncbi:MAG: nuclear transport factor 2 family protein [Kiritimatiellia bacterium]|nr:nuclear transport factor 2 family protein [Pseudomonadales bacterium]MDP7024051.1 nuclear transport factor 2 family protein [Kiritimatiellia bacterium]